MRWVVQGYSDVTMKFCNGIYANIKRVSVLVLKHVNPAELGQGFYSHTRTLFDTWPELDTRTTLVTRQ